MVSNDVEKLREFYQNSFEEVSAAILVVHPKSELILCGNQHCEDLTGYETGELANWPFKNIFFQEDHTRIMILLRDAEQQLSSDNSEIREHSLSVRKKSRRRVYCDVGIRKSKRDRNLLIFTMTDISEIKIQEMELRASYDYRDAILNSVNEMIFVIEPSGFIHSSNTSAHLNLDSDFKNDNLVGQHFSKIFPELPSEQVVYGSLPSLGVETTAVRLNLSTLPVFVTSSVLLSTKISKRLIILVANDITDRKAHESKIAEQQMMLIQAAKLSSLGEMASSIAHEIHNPLQIISGTSELLLMASADPLTPLHNLKDGLIKIEQMTSRIAKTVHGLQALSRDQKNDDMEIVELRKIIDDTLEICLQKIKTQVDHFDILLPQEPIHILCRSTQISQVILNLLNNSCDAIYNRRPNWIVLKAETTLQENESMVEVSVTDSGNGVPAEIANKFFTPFYTTKSFGKGTGLGLSVSKSLIEAHKGSIYLDRSSIHTRFVFRLPKAGFPKGH